jgi:hypothetical protein
MWISITNKWKQAIFSLQKFKNKKKRTDKMEKQKQTFQILSFFLWDLVEILQMQEEKEIHLQTKNHQQHQTFETQTKLNKLNKNHWNNKLSTFSGIGLLCLSEIRTSLTGFSRYFENLTKKKKSKQKKSIQIYKKERNNIIPFTNFFGFRDSSNSFFPYLNYNRKQAENVNSKKKKERKNEKRRNYHPHN